ncbi:hypothetical protein HBI42_190030 [Parastagonospora nodorum]|nr:hypothetical protein HBI51_170700 [Parastagonospora nodorum]KAH6219165.1 hypothetical protein HBI43_109430 [Parastagonospora nodorum]KAH6246046.1 hypothetical protein HBI42_190030 [Parastagonospora nodorum]
MPGLLDLPNELLFDIIRYVDSSPYVSSPNQKRYRPGPQSRAVVCFPTIDASWPSHTRNLLFVCKKLHYEADFYFSKAPRAFELDIAIVNNHWIWPTWTYIPGTKIDYVIEDLKINLIHCCSEDEDENASSVTDSASWATSLDFLEIISHFLRSGTSTMSFEGTDMPKRNPNFRVKTITINVDTASIRKGNEKLSEEDVPFRQVQGLGHLTFDPLYYIETDTCLDNLDRLFNFVLVAVSRLDHGLPIRERVDWMVFSADGLTRSAISIAKIKSTMDETRIAEERTRESV